MHNAGGVADQMYGECTESVRRVHGESGNIVEGLVNTDCLHSTGTKNLVPPKANMALIFW